MNDRVIDLSEQPAFLSVRNGLLVVRLRPVGAIHESPLPPGANAKTAATEESETGLRSERTRDPNEHTIPLEDIAVVIASHPQISYTQAVLAGLAEAGGIFVACNEKHMPIAMLLPLESHSTQTERFAAQSALPVPNRKRLWQQVVQSKIHAQARLLRDRTGQDWGLENLAGKVRSGDPENVEARAARIYWKNLFGEDEFRRNPEGEGLNPALNYGYAVLRAIVARALCASGLHPSLGIHHHNRYDAFCLADDLMEPFRPAVDRVVAGLRDRRGENVPLDKESKKALLEGLLGRFACENESRTLFDWASRAAASLAASVESGEKKLEIPPL
jgi:CRISP-associated protein Cas1